MHVARFDCEFDADMQSQSDEDNEVSPRELSVAVHPNDATFHVQFLHLQGNKQWLQGFDFHFGFACAKIVD